MQRILLALILTLLPALAAEKYTVYETEHFELITDGPRGRAQEVLAQFERVRSFFAKTRTLRDPVLKPRIVLFKDVKDYRQYAFNAVSAAHYVSLPQRDYIAIGPGTAAADRRTTVHEYIHLLNHYLDVTLPVWMNEGVAELYSNIEQIKKSVRVGTAIPEHIFLIRESWIPLNDIVDAAHDSPFYNRRQHVGPFYGISWALVHMLMLDNRYSTKYTDLSLALGRGAPAAETFQRLYNKSLADIEKDLHAYVRLNAFTVINFETTFDKVEEKVAPRPVTDYEWGVATADLLAAIRKYDDAAKRLETLATAEPTRPEAWEALTFARLMSKSADAEDAFTNARSRGSSHPNLNFCAPALTKDRAVAGHALQDVVDKYPTFTDARIRLAEHQLYSSQFQSSYDTVRGLKRINANQVLKYFPVIIQAAWYGGKIDEARSFAAQFGKAAATDSEREIAKKWVAFAMQDPPAQRAAVTNFQPQKLEFVLPDEGEIGVSENPEVIHMRRAALTYVTGTLVNLDCQGMATLHVKSDSGVVKIAIDSPTALQVKNAADGKGELNCGEQSRPVKLGYYPKTGVGEGVAGVGRSIEFLQ